LSIVPRPAIVKYQLKYLGLYYAQPLLGLLARSFGTSEGAVTVVVTVTQVGAQIGLFALVGAGSVALLGLAAVLLDVGMTSNQILSQREIYRLRPDARARLNTVYMGSAFLGGAAGSAIAGALQGPYGWGAALFGASIAALAFLLWGWRQARPTAQPAA
jgi:MFS family permease